MLPGYSGLTLPLQRAVVCCGLHNAECTRSSLVRADDPLPCAGLSELSDGLQPAPLFGCGSDTLASPAHSRKKAKLDVDRRISLWDFQFSSEPTSTHKRNIPNG